MAVFQVGDEKTLHVLGAGEQVGRSDLAALCIDDPRISEAHAMVSLRGQGLKLLALRGRFRVDGEPRHEISLAPNVSVELAPSLFLHCIEVLLPNQVLAIEFAHLPRLIPSSTTTLYARPTPRVKHGYDPGGDAILWTVGEHWRIQVMATGEVIKLDDTHAMDIAGLTLGTCQVPLTEMAYPRTRAPSVTALRIERCGDRVKVWQHDREEQLPVLIAGVPGKICASIIAHDHTAQVQEIIADVWPDDASLEHALRKRFDMGLKRLRIRLEQLGFGPETLVLDGSGTLVLKLPLDTTQSMNTTSERGQDGSI